MRKIIFLDFDGVFNVQNYEEARGVSSFMPSAIAEMNWLLNKHSDAKIVIISSWRQDVLNGNMTLAGMEVMLRSHGLKCLKRIIGVTPQDSELGRRYEQQRRGHRGQQIEDWMFQNAHGEECAVCIIDDCPTGMDFSPYSHCVVDVKAHIGLTHEDVKKAYEILCFNQDLQKSKSSLPSPL